MAGDSGSTKKKPNVGPVPGTAQSVAPSHNVSPSTLGAVSASGRPAGIAGPLGAAPASGPVHNPTPSTLGAVTQSNQPAVAAPSRGPIDAISKAGYQPPAPIGAPSGHNPTPATLGAVPQIAVPFKMDPLYIKTPSTLGAVSQQSQPSPHHSSGPVLGPQRNAFAPVYSRSIGQAPVLAKPERKNRPPLVNYAPGTLKLSILIPTLTNRAAMLAPLLQRLEYQIAKLGPTPEVEVLLFEDNKENPVGFKRNKLLSEAKGDFVVFVDDDDEISDDYVFQIYTAILDHPKVDCIGMRGMITVNGINPRQVIYSLHNQGNIDTEDIYYRPPGHLTPIRRTIAQRYRFPDAKNFGEDTDWAMSMVNDKAIKSEFFIDKVLYHYKFSHVTSETSGSRSAANRPIAPTFSIVILSARVENLRVCLASIFEKEPMFPRDRIIVVDDGAQAGWQGQMPGPGPGVYWVEGQKPFIFSRNANLGIRAAGTDVLLLNDDARLMTKFGFTSLSFAARSRPDVGICSAAVSGVVGNPSQQPWLVAAGMRYEPANLAFVAVYIPKSTFERVGPLDEQFTGYGYEDNDYCLRVQKAGMGLSIYDGCVVDHSVAGNSTFRTRGDITALMDMNRALFNKKWGAV